MVSDRLERHPYSALFSMHDLVGEDLDALVKSLLRDGLISPITTYQGKILDGWNRYQACSIAGVEPVFEKLAPGLDAWEFANAKNLLRRHMDKLDRLAVLAAKLELDREDGALAGECSKLNTPSVREIGKDFQVSTGTAFKIKKILDADDPELTAAVVHKSISLDVGAEIADRPAPEVKGAVAAAAMAKAAASPGRKTKAADPSTNIVHVKLTPPTKEEALQAIIAERDAEIAELAQALDAEIETRKTWQEKCARLEMALLKADDRLVKAPILEAALTKLVQPTSLEAEVTETHQAYAQDV